MSNPRSSTSFAYSYLNTSAQALLDWDAQSVISPEYITRLQQRIYSMFPPQNGWSPVYPEADTAAFINSPYNPDLIAAMNYNPLDLYLVENLACHGSFFGERTIVPQREVLGQTQVIGQKDAVIQHLEFLRQYYLAYIVYLQAINGSSAALSEFIANFKSEKMFTAAKITLRVFFANDKNYKTADFLCGILAHLTLHILLSDDQEISTVARARALEIIVQNFAVEPFTQAFKTYAGYHYNLNYMFGEKPQVYNLIPKIFVTKAVEAGGAEHNDLFFKNATITKIFKIKPPHKRPEKQNLEFAIGEILAHYQVYAIQILHSALRCVPIDDVIFPFLLASLLKLSQLDNLQKEKIFGIDASYRNPGNQGKNATAALDWVLGLDNFGDYLNENELQQLNKDQLIIRVKQQAYRIHQLEAAALQAEKASVLPALNQCNDPQGYLTRLLMPAEPLPDHEFEEKLRRNYRVLAREQHPDSQSGQGSHELFARLQEAYEVLLDTQRRQAYLHQANMEEMLSAIPPSLIPYARRNSLTRK